MAGVIRNAPFFAVVPGPLYLVYIILFTFICLYGFYRTVEIYRISDAHKKNQLKYLFIAFVVAFIIGIIVWML